MAYSILGSSTTGNRVTDVLEAVTIAFASADVTNVAVVVVINVGGVALCR